MALERCPVAQEAESVLDAQATGGAAAVELPEDLSSMLDEVRLAREQGDLEGALALEEHVHSARERLLPADHPHRLIAKQNLALTR